jgi:hypothetical protein
MKRPWYWWLVVFAGTLPIGSGLQYYLGGDAYRNSAGRNSLVVGQIILGVLVVAFGLYKAIRRSYSKETKQEIETSLNLTDDE